MTHNEMKMMTTMPFALRAHTESKKQFNHFIFIGLDFQSDMETKRDPKTHTEIFGLGQKINRMRY